MFTYTLCRGKTGSATLVVSLACALVACAPENRLETRAVISGTIVLHDVDGLNDMSRVRVDIGRGEGGTAPGEDGSFTFQDLEPDEYKLVVTYSGGLTPTASKSAYAPFSQIVQAGLGGNVNLGNLSLQLATGTVEGAVVTSDGAIADGAEVTLTGADGIVRRARVVEGKYTIAEVPVGYHEMEVQKEGYATAAAQTVCRPEVTIEESDSVVTPPAVTLAQSTPSLTPGFGEVGEVLGATWFVSGDAVTIRVAAAYATEGRIWWNDSETPDWSSFQADGYVVEEIPNGSTTVHLQLRNRCGFESPVYDLSLVRDISAPIVTEVRGPSSRQDSEGRTWLTESGATVQLVVSAVDDFSSIAGFAVYHDAENGRGAVEDLVFEDVSANGTAASTILPVALTEGEGNKSVSVYAKDRSGNISESFEIEFRVDSTEPVIQRFALASGRAWTTEPSPTFTLEAEDAGGLSQLQTSLSATFTGSPGPYLSSFPVSVVPPSEDGNREVFVRVWDEAGNMAETSLVLRLDRQAPTATVTTATGQRAFATAGPVSIRIVHDVDAARVALGLSEEACGGGTWSAVDGAIETVREVDLSGADGPRTVRVCVEDEAGNANSYTLALVLDTQAPEGFLRVAEDAAYTKTAEVSILLNAADARSMRLGESPASGLLEVETLCADVAGPAYVPFATRSAVTLTGEGARQVWACLRDEAGNTSLVSEGIVFDETPPRIDVFEVQGEATVTKNEAPLFRLSAIDVHSGVKGMQTSLSGLFSGSPSPYQTSFPLSIVPPEEDGTRAVFVRVWDEAGNHTTTSYSIRLDRVAPSATLQTLTGQTAFSEPGPVTVRVLHDSDAARVALGLGDETCGGGEWSEVDNDTESQRTVELSGADGVRGVRGCVEDEAGNRRTASLGLAIDSTAPDGSIAVNGGAAYATGDTVSVALTSTEGVTVRLGESDGAATLSNETTCSGTEGYAAFRSREQIQLSAEGPRAVWACLRDGAGHTTLLRTTIHLDLTDPVLTSVKVADGNAIGADGATRVLSLSTSIEIEGEGASWMKVTSASLTDVPWQPFGRYVPFTFIPPDGPRVIRVQLKDDAGRVSQVAEVPVELLTTGQIQGEISLETSGDVSVLEAIVVGTSHRTQVGTDGKFLLSGVPGGSQILRLQSTDLSALNVSPTDYPVVVAPGETVDIGKKTLARSRGTVGGRVENESGEPVAGVLVELAGTTRTVFTNSGGVYEITDVPTGQHRLTFTKSGYSDATSELFLVERDQTTSLGTQILSLLRGTLVGSVVREDLAGATLSNAGITVTVFGNGTTQTTLTGADGSFEVTELIPGFYNIEAEAEGHAKGRVNGVYVQGDVTNDAGELRLPQLTGLVQGFVTADGRDSAQGATVALAGTPYTTLVRSDGSFELRAPIGNYTGLEASLARYESAAYSETVTVTESGAFIVTAPLRLVMTSNGVSGIATLYGRSDHSQIEVTLTGTFGTRTEGVSYTATSDSTGAFVFPDVALGSYVARYRYTGSSGWEAPERAVDLVAGPPLALGSVMLRERYVTINNGAPVTKSAEVTLTIGASDCFEMKFGVQPDVSDGTFRSCQLNTSYTLPGADGEKTVYAQFKDASNRLSEVVSDSIVLDRTAQILSFTEDSGGRTLSRNDVVHLRMDTGEVNGRALVTITGYAEDIVLYDDGRNGDSTAADGVYERDYAMNLLKDLDGASVVGSFTDAIGNVAPSTNAAGDGLTLAVPPLIVELSIVPDTATGTATVRLVTDEPTTGRLDWGSDSFYGQTETFSGLSTVHETTLTGLVAAQSYHYRAVVLDSMGNQTVSVDRVFYLRPDPPGNVIAIPGDNRFDVRWEAPDQPNVVGYHVYRATQSGGPYTKQTAEPYINGGLVYHDEGVGNDQTLFYVVSSVDDVGNESSQSAEVQGTTRANTGPTDVPNVISGTTVWSSSGSPYRLNSNVAVEPGATLVVGPGVRVEATGGFYLRVDGALIVVGSSTQNAIFSGSDWLGIELNGGSELQRNQSPSGSYHQGNILFAAEINGSRNAGLKISGSCAVVDSKLHMNSLGLDVSGVVSMFNSEVSSNTNTAPNGRAAGVLIRSGDMLIQESRILHNRNQSSQQIRLERNAVGGIRCEQGRLVLLRTSVRGNYVYRTEAGAGGIFSRCDLNISDSDISENSAESPDELTAGGINVQDSSTETTVLLGDVRIEENDGSGLLTLGIFEVFGFYGGVVSRNAGYGLGLRHGEGFEKSTSVVMQLLVSDNEIGMMTNHTKTHSVVFLNNSHRHIVGADGVVQNSYFEGGGETLFEGSVRITNSVCIGNGQQTVLLSNLGELSQSTMVGLRQQSGVVATSDFDDGLFNATQNYWGPTTTAEMNTKGPDANIDAIHDYRDDVSLQKVDYSGWVSDAWPFVRITAPYWSSTHTEDAEITFEGEATDHEDGTLAPETLTWRSDKDGFLGSGNPITASRLSVGHHVISLHASDSSGKEVTAEVEIDITASQ